MIAQDLSKLAQPIPNEATPWPLRVAIAYAVATVMALGLIAGCAIKPPLAMAPPEVPPQLRPAAGQVPFLEAMGSGVQIYECTAQSGKPGSPLWVFRTAEAALEDPSGRPIGKHYYPGPTWEAADGSRFTTEVKARAPAPSPSAVPWLLAARKSPTGDGAFGDATSILRVRTAGGVAPTEGCDAGSAGRVARVPYTATFYFYRASR